MPFIIKDGKSKMALTARQARFVEEYLIDLNATQRGNSGWDTAKKTARSQGQRLLTQVDIEAAIQEAQGKANERAERTQIACWQNWQRLVSPTFAGCSPTTEVCGTLPKWTTKPLVRLRRYRLRCDAPPSRSDGQAEVEYVHKMRMWDKRAALETMLKHFSEIRTEAALATS
jgi:phage terminase small subunit